MSPTIVPAFRPIPDVAVSLVAKHLHLETEKGSTMLTLDDSQVAQLTTELPDLGGRKQGEVQSLDSESFFPPNYSKAARSADGYQGSLQAYPTSINYRGGGSLTIENSDGFVTINLNDQQRSKVQAELSDLY